MKKIPIAGTFLFISILSIGQSSNDTSIHRIAVQVCNCIEKNHIDSVSSMDDMQGVFLKCILDSAAGAIADVVLGGTASNPEEAAQEFGKKMALELMNSGCKSFIQMSMKLAGGPSNNNAQIPDMTAREEKNTEGEIVKVEEKDFLYITIKTTTGRELIFVYMAYVPGSDDWLKSPNILLNRKVSIRWTESEMYQPKIKEFANVKEIKSLTMQ